MAVQEAPPVTRAPARLGRSDGLWLGFVLIATLVVFWSSLAGELVYDDLLLIGRNPEITELANLREVFARAYWDFLAPGDASQIGYWRPLTAAVQTVAWALGEGSPRAFHAVCLGLHLLATAIAFLLARRLVPSSIVAGFTALLFGLHPTHVESVAWISALNDPLAGVFTLLALLLFVRWRQRGSAGIPAGAALCFALGLLAKEMTMAVIPLALAIDLGRRTLERDAPFEKTWARAFGPFLVVVAAYIAARMFVFGSVMAGFDRTTTDFGVGAVRIGLLRLELLGGLLHLCAWPFDLNLFRPFRPTLALTDPALVRAALAVAFTTASGWFLWRRRVRPELAALLMIPAGFLPVLIRVNSLGSFPLSDRFLYVPVLGFALLVTGLLFRRLPRPAASAILALLAGSYAWKSHDRIGFWHDEVTLFRTAAAQSPRSPYVHWGHGRALLNRLAESGDPQYLAEAFAAYERAQDLLVEAKQPDSDILVSSRDYLQANLGLGWCYVHEGIQDDFGSFSIPITLFQRLAREVGELMDRTNEARSLGIRVRDEHLELELVFTALGAAHLMAGELKPAEENLKKALALNPNLPEAHQNLGRLYAQRAEWRLARHHFEKALSIRRGSFEDKLLLAQTLQTMGEDRAAEELALELVDLDLGKPQPMTLLAAIRLSRGQAREALTWIDRALQADPDHGHAWYLKAKSLLSLNVNQEATITAFRRATALMPDNFEANYDFGAFLLQSGADEAALPFLVSAYASAPEGRERLLLLRELSDRAIDDPGHLLDLARIEDRRGDSERAEFWLDRVLEAHPAHGLALYEKSRLLARLGRYDEALELGRRACEARPEDFVIWSEVGAQLADQGRTGAALERLERSLSLPRPPEWSEEMFEQIKQSLRARIAELEAEEPSADAE